MTLKCAIYCTVIDNFGDVGVCWRLARQLAEEFQIEVVLWVDDLVSFSKLAPALQLHSASQRLGPITVCLWQQDQPQNDQKNDEHYDLVIEGFGCRLPDAVIDAMAMQAHRDLQPPLWINLEYLSAEPWVIDCHRMPSTHPKTGLIQHFWFPSFYEESGGLLREKGLLTQRDAFQKNIRIQKQFWVKLGIDDALSFDRRMSLFTYENDAIHNLLTTLASDQVSTLVLIPMSKAVTTVNQWSDWNLKVGEKITRGALTIKILPFMDHTDYDLLLWACDLNIVRGEDSFIRAQWAGKPLLWQIYPQEEDTHLLKLEAFLDLVAATVEIPSSWRLAMVVWNNSQTRPSWIHYLNDLTDWQITARTWQEHLTKQSDLATQLVQFFSETSAKN